MSYRITITTTLFVLLDGACFDSTVPEDDDPSTTSESGSSSVGVSTSTTGTADTGDATTGDTLFPDESSGITGLESSETTESSSTDESSSESTTGEPAQCDATAPFGEPVLLEGVNTEANEYHIAFTPDELVAYVTSNRQGSAGADVYTAVRLDRTEPFGAFTPLSAVNTAGGEFTVTVTGDGLTLYVDSNAAGLSQGGRDVMVVTRNSPVVEFGPIAPITGVNTPSNDFDPNISADGTVLYFATNRLGANDIFRATLVANGTFGAPAPVGALNSAQDDSFPVVSADGLTVVFLSERQGGLGGTDLWLATRSTPEDEFGDLRNVTEVNSGLDDYPAWLSPDGCRLYFSSTRPGVGGRDLWIAERQ